MSEKVTLYIDGKEIQAEKGANLLQVARENGFDIPGLCYYEKVTPSGDCRLCVVKVEGRPGMVPSCMLQVEAGMKITAFDSELEEMRKLLLELILSEHNDDCINCTRDGDCELQDLAFRYGVELGKRRFPSIWREVTQFKDEGSPVLLYDSTKCIKCGRCIKACYEIQGKGVLNFANRGMETVIVAGLADWKGSECDGCGECVQACPVGAIVDKPVYGQRVRKKDVEKHVVTTCAYCGVGCQLNLWVKNNRIIKVKGEDLVPNFGATCVKGRFGLDFVDNRDRLTTPLIKENGKFREADWDEALDLVARRLSQIKEKHGPDSLAGLSSARCTNEENFVFQKFMRAVIGTNNVDHCARLCHASTVAGLASTFGSGAMTNSIEELEHADVILVTGSNTTETHPVIATRIKRAVLFHGAKLIVVDPRKIDLVKYATVWMRQRNGTDVAWMNGMMNVILKEGLEDKEYIASRTEGYEEFKKVVEKYTPEKVEEITGIPKEKIIEAARIYANAKAASIVYSMGITQHTTGTDNVRSTANLSMLTGNVGKESAGVNPLRGQNNVQGACDMGALPNVYPGYQAVTLPAAKEKFSAAWGREMDDKVGLTVVEMMNAAAEKKVKAMYLMGENPMVSDPNLNHVKEALEALDFLVVQDIFLTETAQMADVVLPVMLFAEKEGNYTNTERRVLWLNKAVDAPGKCRVDWEIVCEIARRMGYAMDYDSIKDIIDEINALTPQYAGITYERIMNGERLQWPCPDASHPGTKFLHKDKFARGKGLFFPVEHIPPAEWPDEAYPFMLSTGRILFHYHTGSMSRRAQALNEYVEGPYMEMHARDMERMNIRHGEEVLVSSRRGQIKTVAMQSDRVDEKSVFIPFHFAEAAANVLTNDALDPVAKIPEFKVAACKIEKIG
ncbi:MAG: formate dehydrogenase subunit alpha [Acidobacteriota bacterium]|jgi:formate dehydrogenase alpha subunit|nr:formate dehydrogenase subunit alpha [Acidobacteriota bacterium]